MVPKFSSISRRCALSELGAITAGVSMSGQSIARPTEQKSLKEIAASKGILFGSALGSGPKGALTASFEDPKVRAIIARECGVIVPENEMKAYVIGKNPHSYDFRPADRILGWARRMGLRTRGHALLWNRSEYIPDNVRAHCLEGGAKAANNYLHDYVHSVCDHFGNSIYSWDVVNETIDPSTGEMRETIFTNLLGLDAIKISYQTMRERLPGCQAVYNDYMSWERSGDKHRTGVVRFLEKCRKAEVPIGALGLQSHIGLGDIDHTGWRAFIDDVVSMGYNLLITEFDVNDHNFPADVARRDACVASMARDYLDMMLSYPQLNQVLCWGMVDRYSWLQDFGRRDDGLPSRPCAYDGAYRSKALHTAISEALDGAKHRPGLQLAHMPDVEDPGA